jgi:hypothetical protein
MELWQQIGTVLGVVVVIGGFLVWHFRSIHDPQLLRERPRSCLCTMAFDTF